METAILLGDVSVLDRIQLREAVLRIPEVSLRIKEIQRWIDKNTTCSLDLFTSMHNDDMTYLRSGVVRGLCVTAVQIGLYDRYTRRSGSPKFVIGIRGTLQFLRYIAGNITLDDLLIPLFATLSSLKVESSASAMFAPQTRAAYDIVKLKNESQQSEFSFIDTSVQTSEELITYLVDENDIGRLVNIGPGEKMVSPHTIDPCYERVQVLESIETDPQLSWFWPCCQRAPSSFSA